MDYVLYTDEGPDAWGGSVTFHDWAGKVVEPGLKLT